MAALNVGGLVLFRIALTWFRRPRQSSRRALWLVAPDRFRRVVVTALCVCAAIQVWINGSSMSSRFPGVIDSVRIYNRAKGAQELCEGAGRIWLPESSTCQ